MTTRTALQGSVTAAGPIVLAAGTAILTVALANSAIGGPQGQAALPRQTVTATPPTPATGSASAAVGGRASPSPTPSGRQVLAGPADVDRPDRAARGDREADTGNASGQGETDPEPSSPAEERCPDGQLLTVNLPLGALPCDAVQIGGSR